MIGITDTSQTKDKLSILDVVAHDGLTVVQRGGKFSTLEHDSLILYPATNTWARFSQSGKNGKTAGGDVYQWYMHYHRVSFEEAHQKLSAMVGVLPAATVTDAHGQGQSQAEARDYQTFAINAHKRLQRAEGEPVAAYLAKRGISLDSAKHWGLGAHHYVTKSEGDLGWAVTFPYRNIYGQIVVNMRLIDRTGKDKCRHWGQRGGLFGERLCKPHMHKYLFVVEGETNAVSIGTVAAYMGVDVLSIGNKSLPDEVRQQLVDLAKQYRRLFIWTDETVDTQKILACVPGAIGYKSPKPNNKKLDANDMLQQGFLAGYVATIIERHAKRKEVQRLYFALFEKHRALPSGLDSSCYQVAELIAAKWADKRTEVTL